MKFIWNQTLVIKSSVMNKYCIQTLLGYIKWRRCFKKVFFFLSKNTAEQKMSALLLLYNLIAYAKLFCVFCCQMLAQEMGNLDPITNHTHRSTVSFTLSLLLSPNHPTREGGTGPSASAGFLGWWAMDLVTCRSAEWRADCQGFH